MPCSINWYATKRTTQKFANGGTRFGSEQRSGTRAGLIFQSRGFGRLARNRSPAYVAGYAVGASGTGYARRSVPDEFRIRKSGGKRKVREALHGEFPAGKTVRLERGETVPQFQRVVDALNAVPHG